MPLFAGQTRTNFFSSKNFMRTFLIVVVILITLVFFGGTLYFLYWKDQEKPVVYKTEKPFVSDIILKTVATGSVEPRKEIFIKPRVSGIIEELYVEAGQLVKKGDVIARIKIIPDMVSLNNAESRLNLARIAKDNAQLEYDRNKQLFEKGVIAASAFQPIQTTLKSAVEEVNAAENHLYLIREGVAKKSGESTNTLVRSTTSGMVLSVLVKEGYSVTETNTFNEGTTIATVADLNDMIFKGKIDESEVGKISVGMPLILTIGAIDDHTFDATLSYISPKGILDRGSIQFEIEAEVELQDSIMVRAGYSANADIVLDRRDSVMAIKEAWVVFGKDSAFVELETSSQVFEKKYLEFGLSDGINIEVLSGMDMNVKIKNPIPIEDKE